MILCPLYLLGGWLIAVLLIPKIIRLAGSGVGIDEPDGGRKKHHGKISRLGGIPLAIVFLFSVALAVWHRGERWGTWGPILLCSGMIFAVGLWDDFRPLGAKVKLLAQIIIALTAYSLGMSIDQITYPGGGFTLDLTRWSLFLTIFWLIAVPNIVNLIDGADGIAGGLGAFLFVTLGIVAISSQQWSTAWVSFAMAGGLIGFLMFNFPPAKIFLGDGGAYLIGFCVASISLKSSNKGSIAAALLVTVVALGLPIADTLFALFRRALKGYPIFRADSSHIHHRLQKLGLSKKRMVLAMYTVCVLLSFVGLSIFWSQGRTLPIAAGILFLMMIYAVRNLGYFSTWKHFQFQVDRALLRRGDVQYALLQAEVLELEVDRCHTWSEFEEILTRTLRRVGLHLEPPVGVFLMVRVEIELKSGSRWVLYAVSENQDVDHWEGLADLFRGAYTKALQKWL